MLEIVVVTRLAQLRFLWVMTGTELNDRESLSVL